jgi:drug/metabolite transporter (DMT)-like permease
MFAAVQNHLLGRERLNPTRTVGLLIGLAGVVLLMWGDVAVKSDGGALAVLAVLATAVLWGAGANYTRSHLGAANPLVISVGSLFAASLFLTPFAWHAWPVQPPSGRAWAEVLFLGVLSSGLGFLMYFRLLRNIGPVRAMSVTFLNPLVAIFAAALYLDEVVTLQMLAGCAVVLFGTALSLGLIGRCSPKAAVVDAV